MRCLLFLCLLLSSLRPALGQHLVTQTVALTSGQAVALELKYAHLIRVRPGTGAALTVKAQVVIADSALSRSYALAVESSADELRVEEKLDATLFSNYWKHDWRNGHHLDGYNALRIDYEVTLPAATPLTLKTIAGTIDAANLTGRVTLKTVSGNLDLASLRGSVQARTVSGDIRLTELPGTAPVDALSVSGNVDASWPSAQSAELSLKSLSGEVYADPAVTFSNLRERHYVGYELRGQLAGGNGPLVTLHTVSGDIFFRKR